MGRVCRTLFHQSQLEKARNIEGKQTDHGWNRLAGVFMQLFNVVILVALGERIVRPEFEFREDDDGNVTRFEVSGSVRRKVRPPAPPSSCRLHAQPRLHSRNHWTLWL